MLYPLFVFSYYTQVMRKRYVFLWNSLMLLRRSRHSSIWTDAILVDDPFELHSMILNGIMQMNLTNKSSHFYHRCLLHIWSSCLQLAISNEDYLSIKVMLCSRKGSYSGNVVIYVRREVDSLGKDSYRGMKEGIVGRINLCTLIVSSGRKVIIEAVCLLQWISWLQ